MESLSQKVRKFSIDSPEKIPWIVKFLENRQGFFALPGKISLYSHYCLHILLEQPPIKQGEAFIIGFCMGNDPRTNWFHLQLFKFFSRYIYPSKYRFYGQDNYYFAQGFEYGKKLIIKRINQFDFRNLEDLSVSEIQQLLGIEQHDLVSINNRVQVSIQPKKSRDIYSFWAEFFKWSSSIFAVIGGFILALNLTISAYGFIILAASSSQLLISSLLVKDKSLIVYSGSILFFVDLLGIYRWILASPIVNR